MLSFMTEKGFFRLLGFSGPLKSLVMSMFSYFLMRLTHGKLRVLNWKLENLELQSPLFTKVLS